MELNVFARGQVATPGRVFVGNNRQDAKLRGHEHSRRNLDTQHLEARLSLAIGTVLQAKGAKLFRCDGAALKLSDALFKTDDLSFDGVATVPFVEFG